MKNFCHIRYLVEYLNFGVTGNALFLYLVVSGLYFSAIMQHLVEWSPLIESWLLSASVWYETFIVAQLYSLFYAFFMLYTVCKTLRLSVFNKELLTYLQCTVKIALTVLKTGPSVRRTRSCESHGKHTTEGREKSWKTTSDVPYELCFLWCCYSIMESIFLSLFLNRPISRSLWFRSDRQRFQLQEQLWHLPYYVRGSFDKQRCHSVNL